ncbi:hypothetical protein GE09DRAFT_344155 [Coniochaeta sp. 2T2.1]|nr:hypothetical protein GE09DRAFT_344155 [Coniochaeta sp. 2T2.1]
MLLHQFETLTPSERDEWAARLALEDFMLPVASAVSFGLAIARLENAVLHNDLPLCKPLTSYLNLYASLDNGRFRVGTVFGGFETIQAAGLLVVACITYTLRCDNEVYKRDDLPRPSSLPLLHTPGVDTLSDAVGPLFKKTCGTPDFSAFRHWSLLQQLGSPSTWELWLRHNIDSLVENLTSGEWVGYYTTIDQAGDRVDAPMRGIHFVVDSDDGRLLYLHSDTGTDGVGDFTLSVTIKRELSLVRIVKRYHGTHTHIWEQIAFLTPLGIAGYWHAARHGGELLGYVWLFKREWAREGAFPDV